MRRAAIDTLAIHSTEESDTAVRCGIRPARVSPITPSIRASSTVSVISIVMTVNLQNSWFPNILRRKG